MTESMVRVESQYGSAVLPVHVTPSVGEGQLFATFHTRDIFLNALTGPNRDREVDTPEYKVTAVRLERLSDGADSRSADATLT